MKRILTIIITLICFTFPGLSKAQVDTSDNDDVTADVADDIEGEDPGLDDAPIDSDFNNWSFHSPYFGEQLSPKWKFQNKFKVGATHASGNTSSFVVGAENKFIVGKGQWRNRLKGGIYYSQSASVPNSPLSEVNNFFFVSDKLEWHGHKRFYGFGKAGWFSDKPSGYKNNTRAVLGGGVYIFDTEKVILQLEGGYHFNHEDFIDPAGSQTVHALLAGVNFTWQINDYTYWSFELESVENIKDGKDFRLNLTTEIDFRIIKHLYLGIGFQMRLDNRPAFQGIKKVDTLSMASIIFDL